MDGMSRTRVVVLKKPGPDDWAHGVPEGAHLRAEVWTCGDDCDCCQARIFQPWRGRNPTEPLCHAYWEGDYLTDMDDLRHIRAHDQLRRELRRLRRYFPSVYAGVQR